MFPKLYDSGMHFNDDKFLEPEFLGKSWVIFNKQ